MTEEQGRKANITGAFWLCCPLQRSRRRPLATARKERKRLFLCLSDRWSCKNRPTDRPTDRLTQRVTNMLTQRLLAAAAPLICDWRARKKKRARGKTRREAADFYDHRSLSQFDAGCCCVTQCGIDFYYKLSTAELDFI